MKVISKTKMLLVKIEYKNLSDHVDRINALEELERIFGGYNYDIRQMGPFGSNVAKGAIVAEGKLADVKIEP